MSRQTLIGESHHLLEVKKSRHFAQASAIESAEEALAFIASRRDPEASHNCWAYRIASNYRFNDDGEPAGTAGKPILAAIDGQGLDGVVVMVTRWFGGIKLGAGGLVRAYGGAAAECLRKADRRPLLAMVELWVHAPFDAQAGVHAALAMHAAQRLAETFEADGVRYRLRLPAGEEAALRARLRDAGSGRINIEMSPITTTTG